MFFRNIVAYKVKQIFLDQDDDRELFALTILENMTKFHIKDYLNIYTEKLLEINNEFQEALFKQN